MKSIIGRVLIPAICCFASVLKLHSQNTHKNFDVAWKTQSENSSGSMPIGNGDIGANVWVTKDGTLSLLISKTDALSEIGRLLKIGKIELTFSPNILAADSFRQELIIEKGLLRIQAKDGKRKTQINCWVDANQPLIHIEAESNFPVALQTKNKMWRTQSRLLTGDERHSGYGVAFRDVPFATEVDTVLESKMGMAWCHENKSSIWQMTLDNQNISEFAKQSKDPLLGQTFGAVVFGDGLTITEPMLIQTASPQKKISLNILAHKSQTYSTSVWLQEAEGKIKELQKQNSTLLWQDHLKWWKGFWERHHLIIHSNNPNEKTFEISQAYQLQRYMNACAGRGSLPIKFNGSIFTVDLTKDMGPGKKGFDADFRAWGANYWFQNTRLIYWGMYQSGDWELMKSFFDMYINALPVAQYRTKKYFNHSGAYFPETLTPWGTYLIDNYGWDRKGKKDGVSDNLYIRYYWQGGLELCTMMGHYFKYTKDSVYFKSRMLPFIKEIISFYDEHYQRDKNGKLLIEPAQSLETFQDGMLNPAPEIAGLIQNTTQLISWKNWIQDEGLISACERLQKDLPSLPVADSLGKKILLPGSRLGPRSNIENPELYAVFPYMVFAVGKPELQMARDTYHNRFFKKTGGWHQDAIQAALLGETEEAKKMVTFNFTQKNEESRFPVFWGPNYDWVPDQDHGSVAVTALQHMLVQCHDNKIFLLPSWPKEWNASFKVHIPGGQILEGKYDSKKGLMIQKKSIGMEFVIPNGVQLQIQ